MPILMIHDAPGGTQEQYEQVAARVAESGKFNSLSDWPVEGILSHAAGPTDDGFRVVDVWESEEAFERFGPVIGPALEEVGFPGEPKVFPLHNFVK
jgi:heme-degrading monooxygenase HmoA